MIRCKNIDKQYNNVSVLSGFSYTFKDNGFYLLYGPSGCGKTTLLNILCGITEFDNGSICIEGTDYSKQVDNSDEYDTFAYISQDNYFVDYLTIRENLELCSSSNDVFEVCRTFNISDKLDYYPQQLSGGQRQRVAIVRALLMKKRILLLDEPTASLDRKNKVCIFELLKELSKEVLIICSSHDREACLYSDNILDFNKQDFYEQACATTRTESGSIDKLKYFNRNYEEKKSILPYLKKKSHYYKSERKSLIIFRVILIIAFIICLLCDTPMNKTLSSMEHLYHVNSLCIKANESDMPKEFLENKDIVECVKDYAYSAYIAEEDNDIQCDSNLNNENTFEDTMCITLPYNAKAFELSDRLMYGSYYTKTNQIMLSYSAASRLGKPSELIGNTVEMAFSGEKYKLEICGIFSEFSSIDIQYLKAAGIAYENMSNEVCINSKFADSLKKENNSKRKYMIYYSNFTSMYKAYKAINKENSKNIVLQKLEGNDTTMYFMYKYFCMALYPLAAISLIVAGLFYYQTKIIENKYNSHIFCVYQYYGYTISKLRRYTVVFEIIDLFKLIITSAAISIAFALSVNCINHIKHFIAFDLFTFNPYILLCVAILLYIISLCSTKKLLDSIESKGWYSILTQHRDLI